MRHGKKDNHLGRTHSHREAMLQNMAASLILHKRIETTVAKAKELRKYVEPILTRAKVDTFQNRRVVFQSLHNKETMKELFGTVADKIADRPGGYTRIIKLGNRAGDNADTCLIELVDFNETLLAVATEQKATKTRRSRRGGRKTGDGAEADPVATASVVADEPVIDTTAEVIDDEPIAETVTTDEAVVADVPVVEAPAADASDPETSTPEASTDNEPKQS